MRLRIVIECLCVYVEHVYLHCLDLAPIYIIVVQEERPSDNKNLLVNSLNEILLPVPAAHHHINVPAIWTRKEMHNGTRLSSMHDDGLIRKRDLVP